MYYRSILTLIVSAFVHFPMTSGIHVKNATSHLSIVVEKGIPTPSLPYSELTSAKRVLALLKGKIGGEPIQTLLADDIAQANTYWHHLLSNSTTAWIAIEAQVKANTDPKILNSQSFQQWMNAAGTGYPNELIAGHPEIYFENEPSNVIQSWGGGPITQFSHDPVPKQPFMRDLKGWETMATVAQTLFDRTVFSYAVSAIREEKDGFGLYFAVYLPRGVSEDRVAGLRSYLTIESANWLRYAHCYAVEHA